MLQNSMDGANMQSNSAKRKLREQLLRRVQVDAMKENFRTLGADRKTIARKDRDTPKRDTTFAEQETMVDFFTAKRAKYRMSARRELVDIPVWCSKCERKYNKPIRTVECECD